MAFGTIRRCGAIRAGLGALLAGLVGGCADQGAPAPVFLRGDAGAAPAFTPIPSSPAPPPALRVVVHRGQTLGGYAYTYHVAKSAIIAANNLHPPYELKAGQRLIIPTGGRPMPPLAAAPAMPPHPVPPPTQVALSPPPPAAVPQPPPRPETIAPPPRPQPAATPEVIPLDGPPPKEAAAAPPPAPATLTPPKPVAAATPATPQQQTPPAAAAEGGGRFPWPVRGRVLANYGNTPGGGHNDGINIAAPRGTPVHVIDAGTVAYSGNEVKGYGNIVLIRHANGWISAYAHLDDVTVKPGQAVSAGEVIAKVGDSGGVGQPQLHFELRRGKKPVDPKEFLAPAPSA